MPTAARSRLTSVFICSWYRYYYRLPGKRHRNRRSRSMQQVLASPPQGAHQTIALGAAVVCMTAAGNQLCRGLGSSAQASRRQQLVQRVSSLKLQQLTAIEPVTARDPASSPRRQRIVPLLTDTLHPKVRAHAAAPNHGGSSALLKASKTTGVADRITP